MRRFWSGVVTATFLATVGLAAQDAPSPAGAGSSAQGSQGSQSSSSSQASSQQKITVSGCIQNAPAASATATTGGGAAAGGATAGATASAGGQNFVLANAKMGTGAAGSSAAVGTSGTAATRYELEGDAKAISPHLNHQVEITGTLQSSSASATGQANAAAGSRAATPKLKVDSVKMVSATCS